MPGMKNNLAAMMDDRYRRKDVARYTDRKDAPLDEAVALLVREKLTGELPPEGARNMVDLWRPWIEEKAEAQLAHLMDSIHDQAAFARMSRDIIAALDMGDELGEDPDQSDENDENSEPEEEFGRAPGDSGRRGAGKLPAVHGGDAGRRGRIRSRRDGRPADGRRRAAGRPGRRGRNRRRGAVAAAASLLLAFQRGLLQGLHQPVRRGDLGGRTLRCRGADEASQLPRQAAFQPAGRGGEARQPAAAQADGAAEPLMGLRPRGRRARCRAPHPRGDRSHASACPSRWSRTRSSATRW